MAFKDLFAGQAAAYARFRPHYPAALFEWLAAVSPARKLAVDVGTGSGQAALALAKHFDHVIGIEPSAGQLQNAEAHPRVAYRQAPAEALAVDDGAADLVLAAQAFHWFVAERFFAEAARVLCPSGVVALVSYGLATVDAAVDAVVAELYEQRLGRFWEPERRLVETGYRDVAAPFGPAARELSHPDFELRHELCADEFIGYLGTWSALARCRRDTNTDPLGELGPRLRAAFTGGDPTIRRPVVWPLTVRAWPRP